MTADRPADLPEHLQAALLRECDRLASGGATDAAAAVSAMLAIARRLPRLFQLPHPTAPGLCLVGAGVDPAAFIAGRTGAAASATGKGTTPLAAALGCLGEAAEYLSQQAWGDEILAVDARPPSLPADDTGTARLLAFAGYPEAAAVPPLAWTPARRLHDGAATWLPAALCYRELAPAGPGAGPATPAVRIKLGSGCAVGATPAEARLHGVLELVERDAVALWWLGGRRPRRVSDEAAEAAGIAGLMELLRRGRTGRRHWLLDVTTDLAVPVVVSASCEPDGSGLACGFAARADPADAIRAAALEMCQMEIVIHLVALKRAQQGEAALDAADHAHLRRCHGFDAAGCPILLEDAAMPPADRFWQAPRADAGAVSEALAVHLAGHGVHVHGLELTREALGIPAFRAISADLQPMPGAVTGPRLARQIERTGGGPGLGGIELV